MPLTFASRFAASRRWADSLATRLQPLIKRAVSPPSVRNFLTCRDEACRAVGHGGPPGALRSRGAIVLGLPTQRAGRQATTTEPS
jgi:hypothetical protein